MRILAIETATEACSVALFDGETLVARDHRLLGRGHAEQLVPMIAELPGRGRAERILVSLGPGSFTGVRIGIATARALGIAWQTEVLGYPTLALVAAMAREGRADSGVTVCMNGGHGEWFVQNFDTDDRSPAGAQAAHSLVPEAAQSACRHTIIAGSRAEQLAAMFGAGEKHAIDLLPDASRVPLLDQGWFAPELAPCYGRGPDARLPAA